MKLDFIFLAVFIVLAFCISLVLIFLPFLLFSHKLTREKVSTYECGFIPFSDSRVKFEIKFYFIGMSFLLFDVEFSFLFPLIVNIKNLNFFAFFFVNFFLLFLVICYLYEWVLDIFEF